MTEHVLSFIVAENSGVTQPGGSGSQPLMRLQSGCWLD